MSDILETIIAHKQDEIRKLCTPKPSLRAALLASPTGIIAEFKRRSPSRGWIHESASAAEVPLAYQQAGAAALSILTDEHFFGGSDDYIRTARSSGVTLPVLYKNFVISELQVYQALFCGASAILLIAACLSRQRCAELIALAHSLGLEVLLELHSESELNYADLPADCIGINNRNLGTFHTDVQHSFDLAQLITSHLSSLSPVLVSESGISDPATILRLRAVGFRGFLIGETFMKTPSPAESLAQFLSQL
ncbi:MAG: indole-3-glycerol-phosphate synthase [Bacteroidaceae bacterium]|nr:indole-3-glycerol-phosphate synthase [Bacteroidaceae bacterium]